MTAIQVILLAFIGFALAGIVLRFRRGGLSLGQMLLWAAVWIAAAAIVIRPETASGIGRALGVGRGADAVVYLSLAALFYLLFKMYAKIEDIERRITRLTREEALRGLKDPSHDQD